MKLTRLCSHAPIAALLTTRRVGQHTEILTDIMKLALRHFQLAGLAASFPLEWPGALKTVFNGMNTLSSFGDQAVALDCQWGGDGGKGGGLFIVKSTAMFLLPPLLFFTFCAIFLLYDFFAVELGWKLPADGGFFAHLQRGAGKGDGESERDGGGEGENKDEDYYPTMSTRLCTAALGKS